MQVVDILYQIDQDGCGQKGKFFLSEGSRSRKQTGREDTEEDDGQEDQAGEPGGRRLVKLALIGFVQEQLPPGIGKDNRDGDKSQNRCQDGGGDSAYERICPQN